jgi:hypothetical protein
VISALNVLIFGRVTHDPICFSGFFVHHDNLDHFSDFLDYLETFRASLSVLILVLANDRIYILQVRRFSIVLSGPVSPFSAILSTGGPFAEVFGCRFRHNPSTGRAQICRSWDHQEVPCQTAFFASGQIYLALPDQSGAIVRTGF